MKKNECTYSITIKEISEMTGMAPRTVQAAVRTGQIKGVYLQNGKREYYWIPRKAFMEYLEHHEESKKNTEKLKDIQQELDMIKSMLNEALQRISA